MIFSGDMAKLDEFTLKVLCAPELIGIDQDPLGKQADITGRARRPRRAVTPPEGALLFHRLDRGEILDVDFEPFDAVLDFDLDVALKADFFSYKWFD